MFIGVSPAHFMVNLDICLPKDNIAVVDMKKKIKLSSTQTLLKISKFVKG